MMIAAEGIRGLGASRRSSNVSIIESESYTPRHNHYTRLAARLSQTNLRERVQATPYVDLTNSRIESSSPDSGTLEDPDNNFPIRSDTFDGRHGIFEYLKRFFVMECNAPDNEITSRRCIIGVIIGILALALIPAHNHLQTIKKDIDHVRTGVNEMKEGAANETAKTASKLAHIERVLQDINNKLKENTTEEGPPDACEQLKNIIRSELQNIEIKKTGRPDYALGSAGGRVVKLVNTENLEPSQSGFFGKCDEIEHGPQAILKPDVAPGQCWAFKGSRGTAIVKLLAPIKIEAVTLEHISKAESPVGSLSSAPRDFLIKGLTDCGEAAQATLLGQFSYDVNGPPIQTFEISAPHYVYEFLEFSVLSNNGNSVYTCVYRLRVHGTFEPPVP